MTPAVFARHESFHPRHGWLKKGFDKAKVDPALFLREDANVVLGVGKNMVRAIQYWCHATKVLQDGPVASGRSCVSRPTPFGELLLGEGGLDPYLEDLGSLWLLHWQLIKEPSEATAWRFLFFNFAHLEFSIDSLTASLSDFVTKVYPNARTARSSLRKDAACIVRMYGERSPRATGEESIQCPFAELGLIRASSQDHRFSFRVGQKPGLSHRVVAAIAFDYVASFHGSPRTVTLSRLLREEGGPGLALRLSEADLYEALERASREHGGLVLTESAGMIQLAFDANPAELSEHFIASHYRPVVKEEVAR